MSASWRRLALSSVLVVVGAVLAASLLGLLGAMVMLPQLGAVGWVAVGLALFLAVQLVLFRLFGLRSRADEEAGDEAAEEQPPVSDDAEPDDDADWRAWRG
jgi:hypothetical protein